MRLRPFLLVVFASLLCSAQTPAVETSEKLESRSEKLEPAEKPEPSEKNVQYSEYPQTVLDVYMPAGSAAGAKRCGVLNIHGGGWTGGKKENNVVRFVMPWLGKGCVVANVEYRLAAVAPAPAAVEDVLQAAHWFHKNARRLGVDEKKIIATGDSAGGHLALMTALTPKSAGFGPPANIAAVVNFYGITDVEDQLGGENMRKYAVTWVPPDTKGRMELARRVSPLSYVRKGVPPVLTVHGTADPTVPYEHGVRLTKALREAGADAEMISVSDGEHGRPVEKFNAVWPQIFEFLSRRKLLS